MLLLFWEFDILMKYIVLDLEFNQAFDFGNGRSKPTDERCPFEIIQIGAVRLDDNFKYEDSLSIFIEPSIYKRLHPYVARITGLKESHLSGKQKFPHALAELHAFACTEDVVYCVWGANDIKELRKNMNYYKLTNDATFLNYIDVQKIASKHLKHLEGMGIGLKNAITALDIEMDKPFHDALNDAEYTAKILQRLKYKQIEVMQSCPDFNTKVAKGVIKVSFITNIKNKILRVILRG